MAGTMTAFGALAPCVSAVDQRTEYDRGEGHCVVCRRSLASAGPLCFCCRLSCDQLGLPLVPVVALADYQVGDRLHRLLRGYKDGPVGECRAECTAALVAFIAEQWRRMERAIEQRLGSWSAIAVVPSTRRPGSPPAAALVAGVPPGGAGRLERVCLMRGEGPLDHLRAHRSAFALAESPRGGTRSARSVLIFDDTTTTGATAQSAAAALRLAGYAVAGVVVVGRAVRPSTR